MPLLDAFIPLSFALSLVACICIARWYLMPALERLPLAAALVPLLLLHAFRFIGLAFLVPGVTAQPLDPRFANPAAWGDLAASLLAFAAIFALRLNWRAAIPLAWVFNVVGTLDLLNAVTQGMRFNHAAAMGATYFIPAVIVPALLVTHAMIFLLLVRRRA
jgi:hypothetical protein